MNMFYRRGGLAGAVFAASVSWSAAQAAEPAPAASSAVEAVTGGKLLLNLRPRLEFVDQDGKPEDAKAFTLRTLLGWETLPYYGFAATLQAINVTRIGDKDYNDQPAQAASSPFPLVADPRETDVNQLFVDYTGLSSTKFRLGKQSIKLDNVRFVGNVEFRQVMQVFNGLTVENKSLPNTELYFGHLQRIKSIFAKQREAEVEIAHLAYKLTPSESVIGYGYFQDDPNSGSSAASDISNRILGVRVDGAHPFGEKFKLLYTAEYAKQDDYAGGDAKIDADYQHFGIGPRWGDWYVRADHEKLGSNDGNYAFQTPLGTNHLFQGWADLFLTTPAQGLRDVYATLGGKIQKLQIYSEYHRFKSDFGSIDFGKELDLGVTYPFTKQLSAKMEYADYREGDVIAPAAARKRDTTKVWVTLIYSY